MDKKILKGRTVRSALVVTAAAAMLIGNISALAAEGDQEEPAGIFWENDLISGTVTEVGSGSITISVSGGMEDIGFGMAMPGNDMQMGQPGGGFGMGMPGGQTPPEFSEGERPELPEGERPELPEGERPELPEGERPELPEGERPELPEGEKPEFTEGELPELPEGVAGFMGQPEGMPQGGQPQGMPQGGQPEGMREGGQPQGMPSMGASSEIVVNVDDSTVITKGIDAESASLSDITAGTAVMVSLDQDTALAIVIMG